MTPGEFLALTMFASFIALVFPGFPVAWVLGGLSVVYTALAIATFVACGQQGTQKPVRADVPDPDQNYLPTVLSEDTTDLWIGEGDLSSNTVLVIIEGGPHNQLNFEWAGREYAEFSPQFIKQLFFKRD